jgi:DNA-directed RNA polymerase
MKRAIEPVAERIRTAIEEAERGRAGPKVSSVRYLRLFDPNVTSFFTAKTIIDKLTGKTNKIQSVANSIGKALEDELRYTNFELEHPWLFKKLLNEIDTTRARKRQNLVAAYNRYCQEWVSWGEKDRIHLGMMLIEMFISTTGFAEEAQRSLGSKKTEKILIATQAVNDFIKNNREVAEMLSPVYEPMVVPPVDWQGPRGGGYLTHHIPPLSFIKTTNRNYLEELEGLSDQMEPVYRAVNHIQKTPWQVNSFVLAILQILHDNGTAVANLAALEDEPLPPRVVPEGMTKDEMSEEQLRQFKLWKQRSTKVYEERIRASSKRLMTSRIRSMAEKFSKYNAIYFVHTADFRGRLYPASSYLTPQGNSLSKGLLKFADGKPLGTNEAACELAIHGANCFGYDKASMQERVDWVVERSDMICRVAADPLGDLWWAREADDPFSFAAFCEEWAGYCENGYDHVSYIPIAKDGACNGLQHLSSCLLDRVGGAQVNILPSDKPADIYQTVADKTIQKVKDDLASTEMVLNTHSVAQLAAKWLEYGINRRSTKRCTMTRVYGSTLFSARAFVQEYLTDTDAKRKVEDRDYVSPLHELEFPASVYLAQHVWASINETVVAAQTAMDWMQDAARELAKENLPIVWTTTDGLPVMQSYPDMTKRRLKTKFGDKLVYLTIQEANANKLDRRRQGAGVSPNVVHSWDSAHLRMTVNLAADNGVTHFGMIHDSFSCHASDIEMLGACTREAFVWIYEDEGPLQRLKEECEAMLGRELPALPPRGDLDIRDVLHSEFFFS